MWCRAVWRCELRVFLVSGLVGETAEGGRDGRWAESPPRAGPADLAGRREQAPPPGDSVGLARHLGRPTGGRVQIRVVVVAAAAVGGRGRRGRLRVCRGAGGGLARKAGSGVVREQTGGGMQGREGDGSGRRSSGDGKVRGGETGLHRAAGGAWGGQWPQGREERQVPWGRAWNHGGRAPEHSRRPRGPAWG